MTALSRRFRRFCCWLSYQRHLSRLIEERVNAGYNVSEAHMEQMRAEARRRSGFEGRRRRER